MTSWRAVAAAWSLLALAAPVGASDHATALADFQKLLPPGYSKARLSAQDQLILEASEDPAPNAAARRRQDLAQACGSWTRSLQAAGVDESAPYLMELRPSGGSLWRCAKGQGGKAEIRSVEEWSDDFLPFAASGRNRGRLFGFLGGQLATGGAIDSMGFNARLGSTLMQDRYDAAVSLGYVSFDSDPAFSITSLGLVLRELFPLSRHAGWNAGVQLLYNKPSIGDADTTVSALTGVNFYLPGGSFDVTLTAGTNSRYSLLLGYTFYLSQTPLEEDAP